MKNHRILSALTALSIVTPDMGGTVVAPSASESIATPAMGVTVVAPSASGSIVAPSAREQSDFEPDVFITDGASDSNWDIFQDYVSDEPDLSQDELDQLEELLEQFSNSPININTATQAELQQLPFLTESQIEDIHAYIYYYGTMVSLGELQLIGSLDWRTRRLLEHFVYAGPVQTQKIHESLKDFLRYSRNTLVLKSDVPLYRREGFKYHSPEELQRYPNRSYLGTPVSHSIRWQFTRSGKLKMGLTFDKDAGEPFFERSPVGYDFCSPYFTLTDLGIVRQVTVGNMKAGFGRGLLIDCGMGMGKRNSASRPNSSVNGIAPHSSAAEYGFFQGVATSIGRDRFWATVMLASTPIDATVKSDADGNSYISSFKKDGYHRTKLEFSRRHNETQKSGLVHLNWHDNGITVGVTGISEQLSLPSVKGAHFNGFSSDFSLRRPRVSVWSECAVSMVDGIYTSIGEPGSSKGVAWLGNALLRLSNGYNMNVIARYYSPDYYTLHSSALADGGVYNECGMLVSLKKSTKKSSFDGYMDLFRHMEPSTTCSAPSNGFEMDGRFNHILASGDQVSFSARYKVKQKDCSKSSSVEPNVNFKSRLKWDHSILPQLTIRGQADITTFKIPCEKLKKGAALGASAGWTSNGAVKRTAAPDVELSDGIERIPWVAVGSVWAGLTWFYTESYDCAVYSYERGLRYSFNNQTLNGHGLRMYLMARIALFGTTTMDLKLGSTCYFDRNEISSSTQKIAQSHKEDLSILLLRKF